MKSDDFLNARLACAQGIPTGRSRLYGLCFHSPHPSVQERTFRGGRDGPSGCEFRWKLEREGNLILGSLSLFLDRTGQATAIIQTTALHQEANHRKKKCEQSVHAFLRGEFFIHNFKDWSSKRASSGFLFHSR